jgi:hypothetical protein
VAKRSERAAEHQRAAAALYFGARRNQKVTQSACLRARASFGL